MVAGKSSKFLKVYSRANCGYVNSFSHDGPSSPTFQGGQGVPTLTKEKTNSNEAG